MVEAGEREVDDADAVRVCFRPALPSDGAHADRPGPGAVVFQQADDRLHGEKALLVALMG
ncbi:MAG: hypothetical protein A3I61_10400 [Acidobacteria bacterium RIFCSPLOWO2_02_FULL_68_18]|nr:MAG: hypothetical protein A3I61_10400 [Acidobacteria bacterium RIFCSPLOWO2_02_FULL_68_18]OFW48661.1 MAG: hypothetical protein A3G77_14235 [Acidobacteria bacterium RIFCSPLOWO2_12_FULL_68_19]